MLVRSGWCAALVALAGAVAVPSHAQDGGGLLDGEREQALPAAASGDGTATHLVPMFPSASDPTLQGFARVVNRSSESGEVSVLAIDDTGASYGPLTLSVAAGETAAFNSDDLEAGNAGKGLTGSTGAGQGDWYLELSSALDIEVLSYIRIKNGFLTAMHDLAPADGDLHRIAIFNPGSNHRQESRLRLINRGEEDASVTITGEDDRGLSLGGGVEVTVAAGATRTLTAAELESGGTGMVGALGDGTGKWRLTVTSAGLVHAMSLLSSPTGHLTNLSTAPSLERDGVHPVSMFPSASDETLQGFVRVRNHGDDEALVTIRAHDDMGRAYEPLALTVAAGAVAAFNSDHLEQGNPDKGLTGSTGAGQGDWRLELSSESDIEVLAYIRTKDGFLTAMHDAAPVEENVHRVPIFNPGSNDRQVSRLRILNAGEKPASVSITGIDDRGASPGGAVRVTVPVGAVRAYTAKELELGESLDGESLYGALGDGAGKWRLEVASDQPVRVLSLLSSPTGHLTNLSTAVRSGSGPPPLTVSGVVRWADGGVVEGAVVRARNLTTGRVVAEATTDGAGFYQIDRLTDERYEIEVAIRSGFSYRVPQRIERQSADDDAELTFDVPLTIDAHAGAAVAIVPAGDLVFKGTNRFDLEGKTLTFTPVGEDNYTVAVGDLEWEAPAAASGAGQEFRYSGDYYGDGDYATIDLPFPFPFAGETWTRVYANPSGNISFHRPERENWPDRDPWANGTVREMAAAIDARSATEFELMVAALWALYEDISVFVDSSSAGVTVTWRGRRSWRTNAQPLGENEFQARLRPSGVVEFAYRAVPERDGIVGLFHGGEARGATLDVLTDRAADVSHEMLDIVQAELVDNGSTLIARIEFAGEIPQVVPRSHISYELKLAFGDRARSRSSDCAAGIKVDQVGRQPHAAWFCGETAVGARAYDNVVEVTVSKTLLDGSADLSWRVSAIWWDEGHDGTEWQSIQVPDLDRDLSELASGQVDGNVFEVFHYPVFENGDKVIFSHIHQHAPANAEIGVSFTDFRTDDLFNVGAGTGPINTTAQGIGRDRSQDGERWGSFNLLTSMKTVFLGATNFHETGTWGDWQYRAHALGINWIAHEAVHRWAAHLSFRDPRTGQIESLTGDGCHCHWNDYLNAPAVHPVWPEFTDTARVESSIMGGRVWQDNGDGTFSRVNPGTVLPTGLSALDLYVMGIIPASEVPDTFILRDVEETSTRDTVRATKVPVRIEDIVAAMGPRIPSADTELKDFRLGIYLLHEENRPPTAESVQRAGSISAAVIDYFDRTTDGRMRVVPAPITELGSQAAGARMRRDQGFPSGPASREGTALRAVRGGRDALATNHMFHEGCSTMGLHNNLRVLLR